MIGPGYEGISINILKRVVRCNHELGYSRPGDERLVFFAEEELKHEEAKGLQPGVRVRHPRYQGTHGVQECVHVVVTISSQARHAH